MMDLFVGLGVLGKFGFESLSDLGRKEVWTCEYAARRGTAEETKPLGLSCYAANRSPSLIIQLAIYIIHGITSQDQKQQILKIRFVGRRANPNTGLFSQIMSIL